MCKPKAKGPAVKSPSTSAGLKRKTEALSLVKKYKESASQTSPNFVQQAKAAAKAKKAALAKAEDIPTEMRDFVAKAKEAAINATKATSKPRKKKQEAMGTQMNGDNVMDNPTPAMLERMHKKEAAQAGKQALAKEKRKQTRSRTPAGIEGAKRVKS